jgi:hypothetical protein
MADQVQLDVAAAAVGKSEITLRRLIKAEKIPYRKERTLTGFIYLVDPDAVSAYYASRDADIDGELSDEAPTQETPIAIRRPGIPAAGLPQADPADTSAGYWQKKADLYEERYYTEAKEHSQTREELGVWRGRAEQTQSMLMKMLPANSDVEIRSGADLKKSTKPERTEKPIESRQAGEGTAAWLVPTLAGIVVVLLAAAGFMFLHH